MKTIMKPTPQRSRTLSSFELAEAIAPSIHQVDMESIQPIMPTPAGWNSCPGRRSEMSLAYRLLHGLRYAVAFTLLLLGASQIAWADEFYFTRSSSDQTTSESYTRLWIWNDATNVQTFRGVLRLNSSPVYIDGIATQPTVGTLYGFINDDITNAGFLPVPSTNYGTSNMRSALATINPANGVVTRVGTIWHSNRHFAGAGFDPQGRLWAIDAAQDQICQINPATGGIVGTPISTGFDINHSVDLDFSTSGLGIIAYHMLDFYLFNPLTQQVNTLSLNSTPIGFDSNLSPPYAVNGIAFTSNLAARGGRPAATSCRFNIVEGRGDDQLGMVNDPFSVTPFSVYAEALQNPDPSGGPLDNSGPGDMARVGGPFFAACLTDYGDAPISYEQGSPAGHTNNIYMSLGSQVDIETGPQSSTDATGDDVSGTDDEDALSVVPTLQRLVGGGNVPYSVTVPVRNELGSPLTLAGFLDADQNGVFQTTERVIVTVPATGSNSDCVSTGANTWNCTLNWSLPVANTSSKTILRLRLGAATDLSNTTAFANGKVASGEVEDYQVCVAPLLTSSISSTTVCSGDLVPITFTTIPSGQQVVWSRSGGTVGTVMGGGNANSVLPNDGTTPITYTYQAWVPAQGPTGCSSNTVTTTVTVNPRPIITPSVCSQTICSGQTGNITFISSVPGSTIHWERTPTTPAPASGTGDISQSFINTGPTSLTYTYKIWATSPAPASCPSSTTITCEIVVTPGLEVMALASSATVCVGSPLSLSASVVPAGMYTYAWTGPNGFVSSDAMPTVSANAGLTQSGSYTVVVTDAAGCSGTAVVEVLVENCCFNLAVTNNSPVCATNTLQLSAFTEGGSGNFTYSWTGPNGFVSTEPNPSIPNATTAASGIYVLIATDVTTACSQTATTNATIATQPVLAITGAPGMTICSGQSTTLSIGGDNDATVTWTGSNGQSGTGTSINTGPLVNYGTQPFTVVYKILAEAGGTCSDSATVLVTVNPEPRLQIKPVSAVYCDIEQVNITATAFPSNSTVDWTRTPNTPNPPVDSGTGNGTVNIIQQLPAASYTYTFTATNPTTGCSSQPVTIPITVQQ